MHEYQHARMNVWGGVQCSPGVCSAAPGKRGGGVACFSSGKVCMWRRSRTHLHPFVLHSAPAVHAACHGAAAALPAAIPLASKVVHRGEHVLGSGERETLRQRACSATPPEVHMQCSGWEGSCCHGSLTIDQC